MIIYHGSEKVITPRFGGGKAYNDYGPGFYCSESLEMAKEWACSKGKDGYANSYELDLDGLSVLNLNNAQYNILNWLAILLENRKFVTNGPMANQARTYIIEHFLPEYKGYDIIKGYRADDSYFSFASDFINNSLSLRDLKSAMALGTLGEQIVVKSESAYSHIKTLEAIPAYSDEYFQKYTIRDQNARDRYRQIASRPFSADEIYVMDIIRQNIENGDPRL